MNEKSHSSINLKVKIYDKNLKIFCKIHRYKFEEKEKYLVNKF